MKCPNCSAKFAKVRAWQKCCSNQCAQALRNKRRALKVKKALKAVSV